MQTASPAPDRGKRLGAGKPHTAERTLIDMGLPDGIVLDRTLKKGRRNLITDVPGVRVGHVTRAEGDIQTGVTAVIPADGSLFDSKLPVGVHVINGYGKSAGLMQLAELGTLETPILLTNTFSVAAGINGLLSLLFSQDPEIGRSAGTVNPVVLECCDAKLNDLRARAVTEQDVLGAVNCAAAGFAEGAVGGGRGMCCYGFKGGIGSASRIVPAGRQKFTVGALLMTNFGARGDLTIGGKKVCRRAAPEPDRGSCIILLATDAPLTVRQLCRCARRAQNGLARTGSITGSGSGEIALMFSSANRIPAQAEDDLLQGSFLPEPRLENFFRAVTECVEESVLSSLFHAETVTGFGGRTVLSIRDAKGLQDVFGAAGR